MRVIVRINDNLDLTRFDLCDNPVGEEKTLRSMQGQHYEGKIVEKVFVVLDHPNSQHMFEVHKDCSIQSIVLRLPPSQIEELANLVWHANHGRVKDTRDQEVGVSSELFQETQPWFDTARLARYERVEENGWVTFKPVSR